MMQKNEYYFLANYYIANFQCNKFFIVKKLAIQYTT